MGYFLAEQDAEASSLPQKAKRLWLRWIRAYFRYRRMSKTRKIAEALLGALCEEKIVNTPITDIEIKMIEGEHHFRVMAVGMENREENLFIQSMQEIFNPSLSPRFVLLRHGRVYCVPRALSKKSQARCLQDHWEKKMEYCVLLYTRFGDGKEVLLKAALEYLVSKSAYVTKTRRRWC